VVKINNKSTNKQIKQFIRNEKKQIEYVKKGGKKETNYIQLKMDLLLLLL